MSYAFQPQKNIALLKRAGVSYGRIITPAGTQFLVFALDDLDQIKHSDKNAFVQMMDVAIDADIEKNYADLIQAIIMAEPTTQGQGTIHSKGIRLERCREDFCPTYVDHGVLMTEGRVLFREFVSQRALFLFLCSGILALDPSEEIILLQDAALFLPVYMSDLDRDSGTDRRRAQCIQVTCEQKRLEKAQAMLTLCGMQNAQLPNNIQEIIVSAFVAGTRMKRPQSFPQFERK